ncbi:coiled-coil alpha-helical rod protein 1-like isoform X2 [Acipenser ruthenus]|uniref:coiled-coil alpha-helical rod protein 1-like isoform X2 n=2 Tax=Acipenser ruthenus TaxID=7906 RepID=UPI00274179B5|nr:coiled-coil alpha-helical rod protein 1-like isoform X2 [Acipenser ruthenus]
MRILYPAYYGLLVFIKLSLKLFLDTRKVYLFFLSYLLYVTEEVMDERRKTGEELNPPATFGAPSRAAPVQNELVPPSHFAQRPPSASTATPSTLHPWRPLDTDLPPAPRVPDPWAALAQTTQDMFELRTENLRLQLQGEEMCRGRAGGSDLEEGNVRTRSLDRKGDVGRLTQSSAQQSRERARLCGEVESLRDAARRLVEDVQERDDALCRQRAQLEELHVELSRARLEQDRQRAQEERLKNQHQAELERLIRERDQARAELDRSRQEQIMLRAQDDRLKTQREAKLERRVQEAEQALAELEAASQSLRAEVERAREQERRRGVEAEEGWKREGARLQEQLQETQRQWRAELQSVSDTHATELAALRQNRTTLQEELTAAKQESDRLREQLQLANEDLSQTNSALVSQNAVVQSLRKYIGELVPEQRERHRGETEKEDLCKSVKRLESEKEALRVTAELLNVRLNSLSDILAIQEGEISNKLLLDPLDEAGSKGRALLTHWRQKVFSLLVQLRSREIEDSNQGNQLRNQISDLEEEVRVKGQQHSVLLHSLQDKAAELKMERVRSEAFDKELTLVQGQVLHLENRAEEAENALVQLKDSVHGFWQVFEQRVSEVRSSEGRLLSLGQRVAFASRRIDTIQGLLLRKEALMRLQRDTHRPTTPESGRSVSEDLQNELQLVNEERERLASELKRTPQLIERTLSEARGQFQTALRELQRALKESSETEQRLGEQLTLAEEGRQEAERRLSELHEQLQENAEIILVLRTDLAKQQDQYQRALQEKVSEAESLLHQELREMESRLNAARREHTKAVVALRQLERQVGRERERAQEAQRLLEEQKDREARELQRRLRDSERDKNLLMATLRQEGLLNQYKRNRSAALQSSAALTDEGELARPLGKLQAPRPDTKLLSKESLSSVLDHLQALSEAVIRDEDSSSEEEEKERKKSDES